MNKENIETVKFNHHVSYADVMKRTGAFFIDVILIVLMLFLLGLVSTPIVNNLYIDEELQNNLRYEMKRSYLFLTDTPLLPDESNIDEINLVETEVVKEEDYAKATYKFYTLFLNDEENDEYTDAWYIKNILLIEEEDSLFVITEEVLEPLSNDPLGEDVIDLFLPATVQHKESTTLEALKAFNITIIENALEEFSKLPIPSAASERYLLFQIAHNTLLIVISSSIILLAIPLFTKNGKTPGKLALRLSVASRYGYRVSNFALFARYFGFLLVEIGLNVAVSLLLLQSLFFPIIPFISLTFVVFTKNRRSVHDFVAGTIVVDDEKSIIYENEKAFEQALLREAQSSTLRDNTVNEEVFSERFRDGSGA